MILGVAGFQNSGKTTLLEILIPLITRAGFRVATVKHVAHDDLQIDPAGTDTHRHKKAGARLAVAVSDSESVYFHAEPQTLEEVLARIQALERPDLILVEGFKGSSIPKIVVGAAPYSGEPRYHWDGSAGDGTRIAGQVVEQLRKERVLERTAIQVRLGGRRSVVGKTKAKLDDFEKRVNDKTNEIRRSIQVAKEREFEKEAPDHKARGSRKRAPGR